MSGSSIDSCPSPRQSRWNARWTGIRTVSDFHRCSRKQPPGRLFANNRRELIFLCKNRDHLGGTGRMSIHEKDNSPVIGFRTQALRFRHNRRLGNESG
jgi:hypothetical protein